MAVDTAPTTFLDLYTDLQNRIRQETGVTATRDIAKRMVNLSLLNMHIGNGEKFPWAERNAVLRTRTNYTVGTITISKGDTGPVGDAACLWDTADVFSVTNVRAGGKIVFNGQQEVYEVSGSVTATTLVLTDSYAGEDLAAGSSYEYFEDEYALASDFLRPIDAQQFSDSIPIEIIGRTDFRRWFPSNKNPNRPLMGTIIDKAPSGDTTLRRLIRLAPPPDGEYRIPYSYVTSNLVVNAAGTAQTAFSADTDEPIVPLRYRHAITLHALANMYRDRKDDARSQEVRGEYAEFLSRVMADNDIGSSKPRLRPQVHQYRMRAKRPWRGAGSRYDTDGRFDRMEF
jgi:hypothetical protein